MQGYLSIVLHAHLPFVRHPEYQFSLEENWLFEAITESYIPLLRIIQRWVTEGITAPLTLSLTPTLCAMLRDPLLQQRYATHLQRLLELAEKETHRTLWEKPFHELALFYQQRLTSTREFYEGCGRDLVGEFSKLQQAGAIEIIASAATHAVLPLFVSHPPSVRAQLGVGRAQYRACFDREPAGIWLPECAYDSGLEPFLAEAGLRWFITDTHGLLQATPPPRFGIFAPVLTEQHRLAAFGRDLASARQVWSRHEGYPGDPRYRDFYRDIGFDLDWDYLRPYLAAEKRSLTGIKYHAITGPTDSKSVYSRPAALEAADTHAAHFLAARVRQVEQAAGILQRPPLVVAPYDAELFGHWWYEGPEFLDLFVRKAFYDQKVFEFVTLSEYLRRHPEQQMAAPAPSSWGEGGYWRMWLDETNQWIYPHLQVAQERMTGLAQQFALAEGDAWTERALRQAARELLLAQASDWPFILRTGTSPEYARNRLKSHLLRFTRLHEQLAAGDLNPEWLRSVEQIDNLFDSVDWRYWAPTPLTPRASGG